VTVTRIACSASLNAGKYAQLEEQARRLGRVRSKVWREYGSVSGAGVSDRTIRDRWMADGTAGANRGPRQCLEGNRPGRGSRRQGQQGVGEGQGPAGRLPPGRRPCRAEAPVRGTEG
jgi:hypothetical protein